MVGVHIRARPASPDRNFEGVRQQQIPTDQLAGRRLAEEGAAGRSQPGAVETGPVVAVPIDLGLDLEEEGRHNTGSVEQVPPSCPAVHRRAAVQVAEEGLRTDLAARTLAEGAVGIQAGHRSPAVEDSYFLEEERPSLVGEAGHYTVLAVVGSILAEEAAVRILLVVRTSDSSVFVPTS